MADPLLLEKPPVEIIDHVHCQSAQHSTTMAHRILFQDLPNEVLDLVLKHLSKDALANVRRASKKFEKLATPFLYRQFNLRYSLSSAAKARAIIRRPDLARLVRDVRFEATLPAGVRQVD